MIRSRLLLADDHALILDGIRSLLEGHYDIVGQVADGRTLVDTALRLRPDLIVLDVTMPMLNGIDAARQIGKVWPEAKFLFLSMHNNPLYLREALQAGASGYVLKASATEELRLAIEKVLKGGRYIARGFAPEVVADLLTSSGRLARTVSLTQRQKEVLQLLAEGHGSKEIASILNLSVKTIEYHRGRLMRVLGVHTAAELASFAVRSGLVGQ